MKLFSCKLRLAGAVQNELWKTDVTAAEVDVLRELHGNDAVVEIKHTSDVERTDIAERARLRRIYANPDNLNTQALKRKTDMLRNLFGHDRLPLPNEISDPTAIDDVDEEGGIEAAPAPVVRTRVSKKVPSESFAE